MRISGVEMIVVLASSSVSGRDTGAVFADVVAAVRGIIRSLFW